MLLSSVRKGPKGTGCVCVGGGGCCPWVVGVSVPEAEREEGKAWGRYPWPVCKHHDKPYQTATQVNMGRSLFAALSALGGLRKNWPFSPLGRVPARWPLADLKGVVPTRSQIQRFGIRGHFPRNGKQRRLGTGHVGMRWLGSQCPLTRHWAPQSKSSSGY